MGARKFKTKESGEPSTAKKSRKERTARRSTVEKETIVRMDETIWKELPEELLESVIARVPIATIIRFRLVCQKWNSLPFLQRRAPQELPLIYAAVSSDVTTKILGALYDPSVKKWYFSTHTPPYYHWDGHSRDSGGGLVCYADHDHASFRVGNHLTRTWKVFPWSATTQSSLANEFYVLTFVDNPPGAGGYKIVWVGWGGKYGVHDYSLEKSTITEGRIPDNFKLHSPLGCKGLAIGSVAYFRYSEPDGIMSYDVVSGTWEQRLIPYPPNSHIVSLAEGGGRLLLVGWVDYNNNNADAAGICPCVCVWELDTQMRSWIEVDRMPTSYCSDFKRYTVGVECLGTRRLLVILLSGWLFKQRTTGRAHGIFAYDVVSREWSKVPECIPPCRSWPQEVWHGISFFPCLSASP